MRLLTYQGLDVSPFSAAFNRFRGHIERGDLKSARIKKLRPSPYYRIKLDDANRLLLEFRQYQGQTVCLALEVIWQHRYDRSRFLRNGAAINEAAIEAGADIDTDGQVSARELAYLHPQHDTIAYQNEPLSFDADQSALLTTPSPLLLLGSAGSGKTALLLERLRQEAQPGLYLTRSTALARHAASLYRGTDAEQVEFLSLHTLLDRAAPLNGQELGYQAFLHWAQRQPELTRFTRPRLLFEELRGVLTAASSGPLDLQAYLALGVRQSLYPQDQRAQVYEAGQAYRTWLQSQSAYDPNLAAHARLGQPARYHTLAIDEVQDLSPVLTRFAFEHLHQQGTLLLAGDAHQLVFPGSFSWAQLKQSVSQHRKASFSRGKIHALRINFRSARQVVDTANRVLRLKQRRFGSLEREDTFLPASHGSERGQVRLRQADSAAYTLTRAELTGNASAAVLVLRDEQRTEAAALYGTPLIFSIENAKGLEYDHIVLHRLVSSAPEDYAEIARGVNVSDLQGDVRFARHSDKNDKAIGTLGPVINSLYVGLTRARDTVTLLEDDPQHPLLRLIVQRNPGQEAQAAPAARSASSRAEWEAQIKTLQAAGHAEQADEIRAQLLGFLPVPWEVIDEETLRERLSALLEKPHRKRIQLEETLHNWAVLHHQTWVLEVFPHDKRPTHHTDLPRRPVTRDSARGILSRHLEPFRSGVTPTVRERCETYGPDHLSPFGMTPLALAALCGNTVLAEWLTEQGAELNAQDSFGHTAHMQLYHCDGGRHSHETLSTLHAMLAPRALSVRVHGQEHHLPQGSFDGRVLDLLLADLKTFSSLLGPELEAASNSAFTLQRGQLSRRLYQVLQAESRASLRPDQKDVPDLTWDGSAADQAAFSAHMTRRSLPALGGHALWLPTGELFQDGAFTQFRPNPHLELLGPCPDHGERWVPLAERFHFALLDLPASYRDLREPDLQGAPLRRVNLQASGNTGRTALTTAFDAYTARLDAVMPGHLISVDAAMLWRAMSSNWLRTAPMTDLQPVRARDPLTHRTHRRLAQQNMTLPSSTGILVPLFSQGGAVYYPGVLGTLSDEALKVLLACQQEGPQERQELSEAVIDELQAAGFANTITSYGLETAPGTEQGGEHAGGTESRLAESATVQPGSQAHVKKDDRPADPAARHEDAADRASDELSADATPEQDLQPDVGTRNAQETALSVQATDVPENLVLIALNEPAVLPEPGASFTAAPQGVTAGFLTRTLEAGGFHLIPLAALRRTEGLPDLEVEGGLDSFLAAARMHGVNLLFARTAPGQLVTHLHAFVPGLQLTHTFSADEDF